MSMSPPPPEQLAPPKRSSTPVIVIVLVCFVGACCIGMIILAAILYPVFSQARLAAQRNRGMAAMRRVATATQVYAADFDDKLPDADRWMDQVSPFVNERDFRSPNLSGAPPDSFGVAFMKTLSSVKISSVKSPATQVLLFDSTLMGRNAASGLETVPKPPRFGLGERGGNIFAFLDGHAKLMTPSDEANLVK
jgi:Tfp pilus assembly protein PilE